MVHVREKIHTVRMGWISQLERRYLWVWPRPETERKTADGLWFYIGNRLAFPPNHEAQETYGSAG